MSVPFLNSINDNIIVYNGEYLPEEIKDSVTQSILTLFDKCSSIFDQKIYRSNHCIWFILSKNICEYYVIMSLRNVFAKATNKDILKEALRSYPNMLQNISLNNTNTIFPYNFNYLFDITTHLLITPDNNYDSFNLL
jgi:hypothetical protein